MLNVHMALWSLLELLALSVIFKLQEVEIESICNMLARAADGAQ